jgi:hypothetical protein
MEMILLAVLARKIYFCISNNSKGINTKVTAEVLYISFQWRGDNAQMILRVFHDYQIRKITVTVPY